MAKSYIRRFPAYIAAVCDGVQLLTRLRLNYPSPILAMARFTSTPITTVPSFRGTTMRVLLSALLIGASLVSMPSVAHDYSSGDLHVQHPWSRALPPVAPTGATYLTIENRGEQSDTLVSVHTPIAGHTELHEHVHENDVMKMQRIDSVEIAPGQAVEFSPGGHHVMLFDLRQPLVAGQRYPMTLVFERAGELEVEVDVSEAVPDTGHGSDHGHAHHH